MDARPRLAVLSAVLPFPGLAGQQQRVAYKLRAFRECFHVTFVTAAPPDQVALLQEKLLGFCDVAFVLPVPDLSQHWQRAWHGARGTWHAIQTNLKRSNYWVGEVAFTPVQLEPLWQLPSFDIVVYEYWHAYKTVPLFQDMGTLCVLDMHNILWQSYDRGLKEKRLPRLVREWLVSRYRIREEAIWQLFDGLITINSDEHAYVKGKLPQKPLFYASMGVDLSKWPYSWQPAHPRRLGYYGGLGNPNNQRDALFCYETIMPNVWERFPEAELWLVGSKPPANLIRLAELDHRVHVTGFVEDVAGILNTLSLVLCPWQGRFGFRSRLIEVMALGVPVITTADAVCGMDLVPDRGLFICDQLALAATTIQLLKESSILEQHSYWAREQVENQYSYEVTYQKLAERLLDTATTSQRSRSGKV